MNRVDQFRDLMCSINHLKVYELSAILDAHRISQHTGRRITEELIDLLTNMYGGPYPYEHITKEDIISVIVADQLEDTILREAPNGSDELNDYFDSKLSLDRPAANREGDQQPCR